MKTILPLIILLTLTTSGFSQFRLFKPREVKETKPVPVKVETVKVNALQEAKNVIKELNSELISAKEQNSILKKNIEVANKKVSEATLKTQEVQKNADALKAWGIQKEKEAFEWLEKYNSTIKRYHKLKNIAAIVAGAFGAMLGMWCMRLVPPVYAAYAFALPIGGAILAFGAVWMFF